MIRKILAVIVTVLLVNTLSAQQNDMYEKLRKDFVRGSLAEKAAAVESAVQNDGCELIVADGLSFACEWAGLLGEEDEMTRLAAISVRNAVSCDSSEVYGLITGIFNAYDAPVVRKACLDYLLATRRSADKSAGMVETYAMNLLDEGDADVELLASCIAVLDKIHSNSSFRVFFDYASSSFLPEDLQNTALDAMNRLTDVYRINMLSIIESSPVPNKLTALNMILENETNSDVFKAEASEKALSTSIIHAGDSFDAELTELQMTAASELRSLEWTRSANLMAEFFPVARSEFEAGFLQPEQFIEIIESVKELSVVKAGSLFTDFLSSVNANVENGLSCSVPVVLAVINSLGALGDKVSFDALLYVSYVPYPDEIILASREALARLKW